MAKRVRYSNRPGSRRNVAKRQSSGGIAAPGRPSPSPLAQRAPESERFEPEAGLEDLPRAASGHLTEAELRRAEELEAAMAAQERAAMAEQIRRRTRVGASSAYADDVNAPLKVRAAHEYAYVARDVRRIILTGGVMLAILAALAILINGMGVISF